MPPKASPSNKRKPEKQSSNDKKRTKVVSGKKSKVEEVEENEEEDDADVDNDDDNDENDDDNDNDDNDDEDNDNDDDDNDDDDDDEDQEDEDVKPKKRAAAKGKKTAAKTKKSAAVKGKSKSASSSKGGKKVVKSSSSSSTDDKIAKLKKLSKLERLEEARKAFKWWEVPDLPDGINWRHLEQSGMVFAANYVPHNIPMKYDQTTITMTAEQEELATFYAAIPEDGPQLGNQETRPVFQENFFKEFATLFNASQNIKDFNKCDFTLIKRHLDLQKNLRKAATNEEKEIKKLEKEKFQLKYSYAIIDGRLEKVNQSRTHSLTRSLIVSTTILSHVVHIY